MDTCIDTAAQVVQEALRASWDRLLSSCQPNTPCRSWQLLSTDHLHTRGLTNPSSTFGPPLLQMETYARITRPCREGSL